MAQGRQRTSARRTMGRGAVDRARARPRTEITEPYRSVAYAGCEIPFERGEPKTPADCARIRPLADEVHRSPGGGSPRLGAARSLATRTADETRSRPRATRSHDRGRADRGRAEMRPRAALEAALASQTVVPRPTAAAAVADRRRPKRSPRLRRRRRGPSVSRRPHGDRSTSPRGRCSGARAAEPRDAVGHLAHRCCEHGVWLVRARGRAVDADALVRRGARGSSARMRGATLVARAARADPQPDRASSSAVSPAAVGDPWRRCRLQLVRHAQRRRPQVLRRVRRRRLRVACPSCGAANAPGEQVLRASAGPR